MEAKNMRHLLSAGDVRWWWWLPGKVSASMYISVRTPRNKRCSIFKFGSQGVYVPWSPQPPYISKESLSVVYFFKTAANYFGFCFYVNWHYMLPHFSRLKMTSCILRRSNSAHSKHVSSTKCFTKQTKNKSKVNEMWQQTKLPIKY